MRPSGSDTGTGPRVNPLTVLVLWVAYLILVFQVGSVLSFLWLAGGLAGVLVFQSGSWRPVLGRMRPFLIFLPILFAAYVILTLILTPESPAGAVRSAIPSALRVLLFMAAAAVFLELTSSSDLLDALRTLWSRSRLRWRPVDDLFLLIYIALRFFPMLKEEVTAFVNADRTLGIPPPSGKIKKVRRWTANLPGLIASCLARADNLGVAMEVRGYGQVLPRGIASPFSFAIRDVFVLAGMGLYSAGYVFFAQL